MNRPRLGIGSYCYPYAIGLPGFAPGRPMDAFGLLERAAEHGVGVVQIADNLPLEALDGAALKRLAKRAAALGVTVEVGMRGIGPGRLERYINIAEALGSPLLRCVVDAENFEPTPAEVCGRIAAVLPRLEAARVMLGIENHDRFPGRVLAGIVERLDSPLVGVVLDPVNSFACGQDTGTVLAALARHTVGLHVKDYVVRRVPGQMGLLVTGAPAGAGLLDIPAVLQTLAAQARGDFGCILELWMEPERDEEATLAKERAWVEESLASLRALLAPLTR